MRTAGVMVLTAGAVLLLSRASAAQPAVELEMQLVGNPVGMGGLYLPSTGAGGLVGLPLGPHSVLMTGLEVSGGSGGGSAQAQTWSLTVPLMLKVYIRAPAERKLVPVLRAGAAYHRVSGSMPGSSGSPSDFETHDLELIGSAGITYFITHQLGLGIDAGLSYDRRLASSSGYWSPGDWSLAARWQASLVLRL